MNSAEKSDFPAVPRALGFRAACSANEKLSCKFRTEAEVAEDVCARILLAITVTMQRIRERWHALERTLSIPDISIPLPPTAVLADNEQSNIRGIFASIRHHLAEGMGSLAHQVLAENFCFRGDEMPDFAKLLLVQGELRDVEDIETVTDTVNAIGGPLDELLFPLNTIQWIYEQYLKLRGEPLPSKLRKEAHNKLLRCLQMTEETYRRLQTRRPLMGQYLEEKHWQRLQPGLKDILTELRSLEQYLQNPGDIERQKLSDAMDALQKEFARVDELERYAQKKLTDLKAQEVQTVGMNDNAQRLSKHAGIRKRGEREQQLAAAQQECDSIARKQADLTRAFKEWIKKKDAFDPQAVNPEILSETILRLEDLQRALNQDTRYKEYDHQEFLRELDTMRSILLQEMAIERSSPVLTVIPAWIRTALSMNAETKTVQADSKGIQDTNTLQERLRQEHAALIMRINAYMENRSFELANYLQNHPPAIRIPMITYLRSVIPSLDIPVNEECMTGKFRLSASENPAQRRIIAMNVFQTALDLMREHEEQKVADAEKKLIQLQESGSS